MDHEKGTVISDISVVLGRRHLGEKLTCKVNSSAMTIPIRSSVVVDMNLAPNRLKMLPQNRQLKEGETVHVTCVASGAKPAAKIYWNSEPKLIPNETQEEVKDVGHTYKTVNTLTFKAGRNKLTSVSCWASNKVTNGTHLKEAAAINIYYSPEILPVALEVHKILQGDTMRLECRYEASPVLGTRITWYRDGDRIDFKTDAGKFDISHREDGSLIEIKAVDRSVEGRFSCSAKNSVGRSSIVSIASVVVQERPKVRLELEPRDPVSELSNTNVTLICLSEIGEEFLQVKWFLDGEVLRTLPPDECFANRTKEEDKRCNVDNSKIILVNVKRSFSGNYSCQGRNLAGWGATSDPRELRVYFPPKGAKISLKQRIVKKGEPFEVRSKQISSLSLSLSKQFWWTCWSAACDTASGAVLLFPVH